MPIYEFRCASCGHCFEEIVLRRSDLQELTCPKCGRPQVTQLLSTFASVGPAQSGGGGAGCGGGGGFT
jgi:putative FmdB family regulatory protein